MTRGEVTLLWGGLVVGFIPGAVVGFITFANIFPVPHMAAHAY
jgi:hypothetical protein